MPTPLSEEEKPGKNPSGLITAKTLRPPPAWQQDSLLCAESVLKTSGSLRWCKAAEMQCPVSLGERLQGALSGCPFLRSVAAERGSFAAARVACSAGPVLEEHLDGLANTYSLFHASSGCPLPLADRPTGVCPFSGRRSAASGLDSAGGVGGSGHLLGDEEPRTRPLAPRIVAPLASISIPLLGFLVRCGRTALRVAKEAAAAYVPCVPARNCMAPGALRCSACSC